MKPKLNKNQTWSRGPGTSGTMITGYIFPPPSVNVDMYNLVTSIPKIVRIQQKEITAILIPSDKKLNKTMQLCFCSRYPFDPNVQPLPMYSIHDIEEIEKVTISVQGIFGVKSGTMAMPRLGYLMLGDLCNALKISGRKAWGGQLVTFK